MNLYLFPSQTLTPIFQAVLTASWQGSLAIGLVLVARRLLGVRVPARWHYLLWLLVLARLLVPAVAQPHNPASLANLPALSRPFHRSRPSENYPPTSAAGALPSTPALLASADTSVTLPGIKQPSLPAVLRWSAWTWAALAWLGGALVLGGWFGLGAWNLGRRLRRESAPADAAILSVWYACCRRLLRRRSPRVRVADWVDCPALVGLWRPTLLLPRRSLDAFTTQDWEHVFAHEIAHLRWRDHWSQGLLLLACCAHWFNPAVWLGLRRLRADRELAADEWVLHRLEGDRALAYGETLFKTLADRPPRFAFHPGLVGISEDGAQMRQRLLRITGFLPRRLHGSIAGLAALLCLGTVVLGQSASKPSPSPTPETKKSAQASPSPTPPTLAVTTDNPPPPSPTPSVQAMATAAERFSADLLAAARAGDTARVDTLLDASFTRPPKFSQEQGNAMTDALIRDRDLPTFQVLRDALTRTNYGHTWRVSDEFLAGLVRDGRTDFLDALLARSLNLDRLASLAKTAAPDTAAWINRRVAEAMQQRADLETLAHAARDGDLPVVQRLLDAGVDVNGVDRDDNTPLIEAVFKNRVDAARLLLDHGALVDKVRFPGWDYTPLCLCNSVEMAQLLKDHGANVHATLFRRPTSILTYVAMFTNADLVEWFLRQGLDPKMLGDNKETLLFGLADGRTAELLLQAGVDPNQANEWGMPPICQARSEAVVQALIDHGAKLTGFDKPLLPRMIQFASGDAVEAALKAGVEHDPEMMQQILIQAAHMDREDTVGVLLRYGAKPNEPGIFSSKTDKLLPLQACTIWGGVKSAKLLLEAGADPNGGKAPNTLLKNAMGNGYKEVARLLRDAGAKGVADLAFALAMGDTAKVKTLLASAPSFQQDPVFWDDALPDAARVGDVDTVRAALAHGVPLTAEKPAVGREDAYTAAANEGQHEALAVLLAARPPDANPEDLRWAMWEAVWNCHPYDKQRTAEHFEQCTAMLLAAHAPLTGYDLKKGTTDLMTAAVFSRNPGGNPQVMEMLARAGVDPNPVLRDDEHPDQPGKPLLDYVQEACAQGNCSTPIADTLVKLCRLAAASGPPTPAPSATPAPTPPPAPSPDPEKTKALFRAKSAGEIEKLLAEGADVHGRDDRGDSPLMHILTQQIQISASVRALLRHGADPNLRSTYWHSFPLNQAKDAATIDALVEAGADVHARNARGESLLCDPGGTRDDAECAEALVRHGLKLDVAREGGRLLWLAAVREQPKYVRWLLDRGVSADAVWISPDDHQSRGSALGVAASLGYTEVARVLLDHGAAVHDELDFALAGGHRETARMMWERGIHTVSKLAYAVSQGAPVAQLARLVADGSPVDPPQDKQWTPLVIATSLGDLDAVRFLVEHGASFHGEAWPLNDAVSAGHDQVVEYLVGQGAEVSSGLLINLGNNSHPYGHEQPQKNFDHIAEILIRAGALKDVPEDRAAQILRATAYTRNPGGNPELLRLLFATGLRVDAREKPDPAPLGLTPSAQEAGKSLLDLVAENAKKPDGGWTLSPETLRAIEEARLAQSVPPR